ncbi:MAG: hypothetical protein DMD98_18115 [Candidatus Rokuibacteriota bacterium]|nr:MAG: hypothetical protein DMD98_18115 [Candidatus Rokubacteria bacterium]
MPAAVALIMRGGRLLLTRRARPPYAGTWDLPGGFLEAGERPEACVRRELREELALGIRQARLVDFALDRYGPKGIPVLTLVYRVTPGSGRPRPRDGFHGGQSRTGRSRFPGCGGSCGAGSATGDARLGPVVRDLERRDEGVFPRLDLELTDGRRAVEPEDRGARRQVANGHASGDVVGDGRPVREDRDRLTHRPPLRLARRLQPIDDHGEAVEERIGDQLPTLRHAPQHGPDVA